ncbi:MAG: ABC transporter permease [Bacteroidota bacterium]
MDKIAIIFKREYLNMVRKKSFLLATFLVPLGFAALIGIQVASAVFVEKESYELLILEDEAYAITSRIKKGDNFSIKTIKAEGDFVEQRDKIIERVKENEGEAYLYFPATYLEKENITATLHSSKKLSQQVKREVERKLRSAVKDYKTENAGISEEQLAKTKFELDVQTKSGETENTTSEVMALAVGAGTAIIIYMLIAMYGGILMQGVIEEKANRIVEVIVSSVRPFQLLMGKTLALASVAITQLILWGLLCIAIYFIALPFVASANIDPAALQQPGMEMSQSEVENMLIDLRGANWNVLWFFPIYFLGGFFLYGSLMAAAGSAVDNIQDAQQFTIPITLPLMLPLFFYPNIIQNPNGMFATITSQVPFFSPMIMPMRIGLGSVPWWEIALSIIILILSFVACVWFSAKIYRTGILMYGKKPSFKEIFKWLKYN